MDLSSKIVVITGAGGLLGSRFCQFYLDAGARVAGLELVSENIPDELRNHKNFLELSADVTSEESLEFVKEKILSSWGTIDVLVNNAAINDMFENPNTAFEKSKFENYPVDMFNKMLQVNVLGVFLCCQVFGRHMADKKSGSIINVASTYGVVAPDQNLYLNEKGEQSFYKSPAYPTTKAAVIHFTKFLGAYWGPKGVRVNCLTPGGVENSQDEYFVKKYSARTPLGRMAKPEDYKGMLMYLASDDAAYTTGANMVVDGGFTVW